MKPAGLTDAGDCTWLPLSRPLGDALTALGPVAAYMGRGQASWSLLLAASWAGAASATRSARLGAEVSLAGAGGVDAALWALMEEG